MTTTYDHLWGTPRSVTTGLSGDTLNTVCHIASDEIDNLTNKDLFLAGELSWELAATPTAGLPLNVYIVYCFDSTNYEDGIPGTNDGTAAASPPPVRMIASFAALADANQHRGTFGPVPILPYEFKLVVYNGTNVNAETSKITLLANTFRDNSVG